MSTVIVPTPLRRFTNNESKIAATGKNIYEAIRDVTRQHPTLAVHLFDEDKKLRKFVRIYLGDEDINALEREQTLVESDSEISIIPAIAGGIK